MKVASKIRNKLAASCIAQFWGNMKSVVFLFFCLASVAQGEDLAARLQKVVRSQSLPQSQLGLAVYQVNATLPLHAATKAAEGR